VAIVEELKFVELVVEQRGIEPVDG